MKILWLFIIFLWPFSNELKAEHVYGGNITYRHITGFQYEILVTLFFDCSSTTDPQDVSIWSFNAVDGSPKLITAIEVYSGFVDTTYQLNPCLIPPPGTCLKKEIYSAIENFDSGLGGYSLHVEEFNRSANILNLNQPDNYGAIFYCTLSDPDDPFSGGEHNGPIFNNDPPPVICINDTVRFDHSVTDPDGDVIVYKFCDPKGRFGIAGTGPEFIPRPYPNVPWAPGYTTNDQLPSVIPFTLDPNSGELVGIANQQGFYVYSVCYEEYRNGVLINEGNRDYMFRITANCTPKTTIVDFASQTQNATDGYCGDLGVQFNDNSVNGMTYYWDFGDGNTSTLSNPFHQYDNPGDYTVTLTINKGMTCELSVSKVFEIYPIVEPFNINNLLAQCENDNSFNFSFAGTYNPYNTISWDFGPNATPTTSSLQNPTNISFNQPGLHNVTLTINNKTCSETDNQTILIKPSPTAIFSLPDSICINDTLYLESESTHTSNRTLKWTHNGASLRKIQGDSIRWVIYNNSGYGIVRLIVEDNGCRDTLIDSVFVQALPQPILEISPNTAQCIDGNSYKLSIGGTVSSTAKKLWSLHSGASILNSNQDSLTVSFNSPGYHKFSLEVTDGPCTVLLEDSVLITQVPQSAYTMVAQSCLNSDTVNFIFNGSAGSQANYLWDFGDINRYQILSGSSLSNPNIIDLDFIDTGYFYINLTIEENGCLVSYLDTIYVGASPVSNFSTVPAQCILGNNFDFQHLGTFSPNASITWDFGAFGPANSSDINPVNISFSSDGLHTITLTTIDYGCTSTHSETIHISSEPQASFLEIPDTCINATTLDFIFNGIAGDSAIFQWDLGSEYTIESSDSLNDQNILAVQYLNPGTKTGTLTIEENGCFSTYTQSFELHNSPTAKFTPGAPQCILINDFDVFNEGTYSNTAQFEWDFGIYGPPNVFSEDALGIVFDTTGNHIVQLIVTDYGCADTFRSELIVSPEPSVYFAKQDTQCIANNSFEFVADGFFSKGSNFSWDFGSQGVPSTANIKKPTISFLDTGWHVVSVTVYEYGCTNTFTDSVYVSPIPDIYFQSPENQCISGNSYDFLAEGNYDSQASFEWFFPTANPNYSSSKNVSGVKFQEVGYNQIELQVHSHGCTVIYQDSVNLSPGPVGFIVQEEVQCILGNAFNFNLNGSTFTSNTNFTWVFGEHANHDTIRQQVPPTISFDSTGLFYIYLTLQEDTCVDTYTSSVWVSEPPISDFIISSESTQCLDGNSFDFLNSGEYGDSVKFDWNFGVNASPRNSRQEQPPSVIYNSEGWHTIQLAIEENGCFDTISDSVFISAIPIPAIAPEDTQCIISNSFNFDGSASTFDTSALFYWDFGMGATPANDTVISPLGISFSDTGWHEISLRITENGCDSTSRINIYVNPNPIAFFDTANVKSCLDGNTFDFINTGDYSNSATWKWYFENANIDSLSTENAIGISFQDTGYFQVQLLIEDFGCIDSYTSLVYVNDVPNPYFENNLVQCVDNNNYNFEAQNISDSSTTILWSFENASPASIGGNEANNIVFQDTGWQTIELTFSLNGCTRGYIDSVYISPRSKPFFSNQQVQCLGNNNYDFYGQGTYSDSANFYWIFENASVDTIIGLVQTGIIFDNLGYNQVAFFIEDNGCTDVFIDSIFISPPPVTLLDSINNQCITGNNFSFTAINSIYGDSASFLWNFQNALPTSSFLESPSNIVFQSTGTQRVELIISENGCADTSEQFVYISEQPDASWHLMNSDSLQCLVNNNFNFQISDSNYETNAQFYWDFGSNATPANGNSPQISNVTFDSTGFEIIALTVSEYQCASTYNDTVWISPQPIPTLGIQDTQCVNNNFYHFDVSLSNYGPNAIFYWDFGPNASVTQDTGTTVDSISFSTIGRQLYSLTISENGCDSTVYDSVHISDVSDAHITVNNHKQCINGNAFQLASSFINSFSSEAEYFFTIENDTFRTSSMVYSFSDTGQYKIYFTVIDLGCRDSASLDVMVYPETETNFNFSPEEGCAPLTVHFLDSSQSTRPLSYYWEFGDGAISNLQNPSNTYQSPGYFDVLLVATADSFCTEPDSLFIPNAVYVHQDPVSAFTASSYQTSMFSPEITFYSLSGDTVISSFIIDQNQFNGDTVSYVFPDTGWYTIYHLVQTPIGCIDSSFQNIYVEPEFKFFSPNAFSPNDDGINDEFLQKGYAIQSYELKIFNRWGEEIYQTDDIQNGWNGISQGSPAKQDIYLWRTKVVDVFGKEWHYRGSLSLLK